MNDELVITPSRFSSNATVHLSGFKHAMVQVICASIANGIHTRISNVPEVNDTVVFCDILSAAGCSAKLRNEDLVIESEGLHEIRIPKELSKKIHGSMYLMPAYICRLSEFEFGESGGCQIGGCSGTGPRPIEHILSVMSAFGVSVNRANGVIKGKLTLQPRDVVIDIMEYSTSPSELAGPMVGGATKTALIMAAITQSVILLNPYLKGDVKDLLSYLSLIGFSVEISANKITVSKGQQFSRPHEPAGFTLSSCISEFMTYTALALLEGSRVRLVGADMPTLRSNLRAELDLLQSMNVHLEFSDTDCIVDAHQEIQGCDITVNPIGIHSDHQPFFALLMLRSKRGGSITEKVWEGRFTYAQTLSDIGASMTVTGNKVTILPTWNLHEAATLRGYDVRDSAALLVAALAYKLNTRLVGASHLMRGYATFITKFNRLYEEPPLRWATQ